MFDLQVLFTSSLGESVLKALTVFFWFVIILIPLVVIHEFGHLLMARLFKVRVSEFGVGIPPRTPFYFIKKGIVWSLNWIPFGGFAKIYGDHDALDNAQDTYKQNPQETKEKYTIERFFEVMNGKELSYVLEQNGIKYDKKWQDFDKKWNKKNLTEEELENNEKKEEQLKKMLSWELDAKLKSKEAFFNRGVFPKLMILLGGVIFNYIAAWIIIFSLLNFGSIARNGFEKAGDRINNNFSLIENGVGQVVVYDKFLDDNKNEIKTALGNAGITRGDNILTIARKDVKSFNSQSELSNLIQENGSKPLAVTYIGKDSNEPKTVEVIPELSKNGRYTIGIALLYNVEYKAKNFASSFAATNSEVRYIVGEIWGGLKKVGAALLPNATDRSALQEVSGPIGVGGVGSIVYDQLGFNGILHLMALISLGLAITNLLPIPALDGGRILIVLINKVTGRRNKKIESILIGATFLLMLLLIAAIAIKDINFVKDLDI